MLKAESHLGQRNLANVSIFPSQTSTAAATAGAVMIILTRV